MILLAIVFFLNKGTSEENVNKQKIIERFNEGQIIKCAKESINKETFEFDGQEFIVIKNNNSISQTRISIRECE